MFRPILLPRAVRGLALAATLLLPGAAAAQEAGVRTLTLEDAIRLARLRNPAFLQVANDVVEGEWGVRAAYGALLPGVGVSGGVSFQQGGEPRLFGAYTGSDLGIRETPDYYYSSYGLNVGYSLSAAELFRIPQAKASRAAAVARVRASEFDLKNAVVRQYLLVLRSREAVELARQELTRAEENLKLAAARVAVGAAIPLDEKQAQVERGRAEVTLLQAENTYSAERLRLVEQLGLEETAAEVELVSRFEVKPLEVSRETLVAAALEAHPNLAAARSQERAAEKGLRMAQSSYLPSLNFSMGWSGYTRRAGSSEFLIDQAREGVASQRAGCELRNDLYSRLARPLPPEDCSAIAFTPAMERTILEENDRFPFGFTKDPLSAQLSISLPLFNGLDRERQAESARVQAEDAKLARRAEELRLRTAVTVAYQTAVTAERSVRLEAANREVAASQLELARERYRVGAANFLELKDAETLKARADRAYLDALYGYHESLAALEAASGRALTTQETGQ